MFHLPFQFFLISLVFIARVFPQLIQDPYSVPSYIPFGGPSWPDPSIWAALNITLGGRLQTLRPWAAVCYTDDPLYNLVECETVMSSYTNHHARERVPSALLWSNWESCGHNNGCVLNYSNPKPVSGKMCHQGATPPYGFALSNAEDASVIVNWATAHGVTLTIKNTGHDYLGRSSRPFSFQVFTHDLNSIKYVANFIPQGSSAAPVPALKIGAGAQLDAIYPVAETHNVSVVLGGCLTVGAAGGFIQGGGHSMSVLSPTHGLAVDNLLEVEIVTADGNIRTINTVQDPDLFWAVSGGGAGSWGIIISITVATLPPVAIGASTLLIAPNATQDLHTLGVNFIALLANHQNQLVDSGITSMILFYGGIYSLTFFWPANKASGSLLYPLFEEIGMLPDHYTVLSNVTEERMYPSISAAVLEGVGPITDSASFYGASSQISSRFIPQSVLERADSIQNIAEAIWQGLEIATSTNADLPCFGTLLGGMPAATKQRANYTGANPAFYDAAYLVAYVGTWSEVSENTHFSVMRAIHDAVGPLADLGLTSSYQNEGSPWESNWEKAFFGHKYDRLLEIKHKYDPTNFFQTYKGVGFTASSEVYSCYRADQQ